MKKILPIIFTLCSASGLFAQLDYTLTYSNSTYTELSGAKDISNNVWNNQHVMKMPFTFKYFDKSYDTIRIMMNNSVYGIFFTEFGVDQIFFGAKDFIPENNDTLLSPISFLTAGTSPNRILKIQYKNVHTVMTDTSEKYVLNNQVWLYEKSNKIEYHFGASQITDPSEDQFFIGMIDYDNSPYLAIDSSASAPVLVRVLNAGAFTGINSYPQDGQVYTLTPKSNVSIAAVENLPYSFSATFTGFQMGAETPATMRVYDVSGKLLESLNYVPGAVSQYELKNLAAGFYLVNIEVNKHVFTEKILIR